MVRGGIIRFFAYGGNEENPVLGPGICLQGAWISGIFDLTHTNIPYALLFINCHFATSVTIQRAECAALYMDGSRLMEELNADGLTTKGDVHLRNGFSTESGVRLLGADIGGNLDCTGGKFRNAGKDALVANELTTKGSVNLRDGFSAEGGVRLLGADIGGNLDCTGGKFRNADEDALAADCLTTKGDVHLCEGFSAVGEVRLMSADIGRNLNCGGGKFHNPGKNALAAENLTTKGGVWLRDGFSAEGEVRLVGADIRGNLDCENGKFCHPKGYALVADRLTTNGGVLLRNGFSAEGGVWFANTKIGGDLDCAGGKFHYPTERGAGEYALTVQKGNVSGSFWWRQMLGEGVVNLRYAKVGVLVDDLDAWKSFKVALDGFAYGQFFSHMDATSRIKKWLGNQSAGVFSPQPYEQAAKVLRAVGKHIDAWDIEREKRRLERAERNSNNSNSFKIPRWRRLWGRAIDALTDFAYRPWKTVGWTIVIVGVSALLFNFADKSGRMVPHQPIVVADLNYQMEVFPRCVEFQCLPERRPTNVVRRLFPDYPKFNALVYSADVFIPFFALHQEPYWYPNPSDADREIMFRILLLWYWLEIIAGWILTSLFLLSVTGLLRPRQSSGERD